MTFFLLFPILLFFISPFVYIYLAIILAGYVSRNVNNRTFGVFTFISIILIFLIYPINTYNDFVRFSSSCENRPPIEFEPLDKVDTIAFKVSRNSDIFFNFLVRQLKLNLYNYEFIDEYNGNGSNYKLCTGNEDRCAKIHSIKSKYIFSISYPRKNENGVLQSKVSIIERESNKIIYEVTEYIFKGLAAKYYGTFISKPQNNGQFACGYLSKEIYPWRTNDRSQSYNEVDALLINTIFPSLRKGSQPVNKPDRK